MSCAQYFLLETQEIPLSIQHSSLAKSGNPLSKLVDRFRQPTGVTVGANDEIMVVDLDGVYKVSVSSATKTRVLAAPPSDPSPPYHGYIFSPIYLDGKYYALYSGTFIPVGFADTDPSGEYSGSVLSWTSDGAGEFTLETPGRGLHVLQVRQGGHAYIRPVML